MAKLATIAMWGASIALVVVLWSYVQQELYMSRTIARKMSQMMQEHPTQAALTRTQWQQVYNLAKASPDSAVFFDFLSKAGIASKASLPQSTGGSSTATDTPAAAADGLSANSRATAEPSLLSQKVGPVHVEPPASAGSPSQGSTPSAPAQAPPGGAAAKAQSAEAMDPNLHRVLTKDMAWRHARENVIIVTWTNFHFYDFVENWAAHLSNHHIENYLVGAMDTLTAQSLNRRGFPYFVMYESNQTDTGLGSADFGWGSGKFHLMGRMKINLLKTFLGFGLDIMLCDTDTVWINDPTDYFNRYPAADILTSSDHMSPSFGPGDDGLEAPPAVHSAMNIGVMFFRHSQATLDFVAEWVAKMDADPKMWDQNCFNMLARSGFDAKKVHESNNRLFYGWNGRLVMGILPVASFASGHTYHVQHLSEVMEVKPYVVHQTFQYGGTKGKRHRLREAQLWYDPPEYYSEGLFVHVELDYLPAPEDFERLEEFNMSGFHLSNMEYQLLQLREAFAVAVALNRTIIMPKLQCFCDRYWGPVHRCRLPGADKMRLPFVCPLDHIFEPFHFDDKPGLEGPGKLGPAIRFREHSFLENERTPESVKNGFVTLMVDRETAPGELRKEDDYHIRMGGNPTDEVLKRALQPYADTKVIRLEFEKQKVPRWMKFFQEPFSDRALQKGFIARIQHMPGFWCCWQPWAPTKGGGSPYMPMIMGEGIKYPRPLEWPKKSPPPPPKT